MSDSWYYTNDGKTRIGPVSTAELRQRVQAGEIAPTDMVWKEGMAKWTPAEAIQGLFTRAEYSDGDVGPDEDSPAVQRKVCSAPSQAQEGGVSWLKILCAFFLAIAIFLSLLSAVIAIAGYGSNVMDLTLGALAVLVSAIGIFFALISLGIGLMTQRNWHFIEASAITFFIGVGVLVLSIGSALATRTMREYRDVAAKAGEVEEKRKEAEASKKKGEVALEEAKNEHEGNLETLKKIEAQQLALAEQRKTLDQDAIELQSRRTAVKKEENELAEKRRSVQNQEDLLKNQRRDVEKEIKLNEKLKDQATEGLAKAEALKTQADKKELEAREHCRKAIEEFQKALKTKKAALKAIGAIGPLAAAEKIDLQDVTYDVCEILAKDKEVRQAAIQAIFELKGRELGAVVATLVKPPEDTTIDDFVATIQKLAKFGRSGLPLVERILTLPGKNNEVYWRIFQASVEVLGELAKADEKKALTMLTSAPRWQFARDIAVPQSAPEWVLPRFRVGTQLYEVCKANPRAQKSAEVVAYFADLLREPKTTKVPRKLIDQNQLLAAEALGSFGADARSSLEPLMAARLDNSGQVREAIEDAIMKIRSAK